jgi:hypothetical protein
VKADVSTMLPGVSHVRNSMASSDAWLRRSEATERRESLGGRSVAAKRTTIRP